MKAKLIKNISFLHTMDKERNVLENASVLIEGGFIKRINPSKEEIPQTAEIINADGFMFAPGMINCHHHFCQTLTRNVPHVHNAKLFDWLVFLYTKWQNFTPEGLANAATIAALELIKTGCTTSVDHYYCVPNNDNSFFDAEIEGVAQTGLRFHMCRGSMSLSEKDGGLPPDIVVQKDDEILRHSKELVEKYHNPDIGSMLRIILAPCTLFTNTKECLSETKILADQLGVQCHTHLAETMDEEEFCVEKLGMRPFEFIEEVGWSDRNCFYAHSIYLNGREIKEMANKGAGACHCPTSNMRLGSGIAPVVPMMREGVNVALGVDGSASNDSSNMIAEARQAMLLQRVKYGEYSFEGIDAWVLATNGGAAVLERDDIGSIEEGKCADMIGFKLDRLEFAGGLHAPPFLPIFCNAGYVDFSMINGEVLIEDGRFIKIDPLPFINKQNQFAKKLLE
ncbi:8-oxoguanine deaminase [Candidatus Riflebacteria bacterium]